MDPHSPYLPPDDYLPREEGEPLDPGDERVDPAFIKQLLEEKSRLLREAREEKHATRETEREDRERYFRQRFSVVLEETYRLLRKIGIVIGEGEFPLCDRALEREVGTIVLREMNMRESNLLAATDAAINYCLEEPRRSYQQILRCVHVEYAMMTGKTIMGFDERDIVLPSQILMGKEQVRNNTPSSPDLDTPPSSL
jgi:hypothetical protein